MRIFTGSECVKWFMKNMVGVTSMQVAQVKLIIHYMSIVVWMCHSLKLWIHIPQDVGQRLMDLNVFIEIQG